MHELISFRRSDPLTLQSSSALRYFSCFYLYMMQGIPAGFSLTALTGYLTAKGADPVLIGSFIAVAGLPWTFQFIWGPLIDRFQYSTMGHRKHWLVLTQVLAFLASLSLLFIGDPLKQVLALGAVFFLHSVFASIQDATADAMIIDIVPSAERGRANAFMRGGFLAGFAIGAAGLSTVLHLAGFRFAAATQSLLLMLFSLLTFFIRLKPGDQLLPSNNPPVNRLTLPSQPALGVVFRRIRHGIFRPRALTYFLLVAAVYCCFSVFIRAFSFTLIRDYHWSDHSLSVLQGGWGVLLMLVVVLAGGKIVDRIGAFRIQLGVMAVLGIFLLFFSGISTHWTDHRVVTAGLISWSFADPLFSVACFPILMGLCERTVEGSQFTTYMAIINLCDVAGSYLTGWLMRWTNASLIGMACGGLILAALWLLKRFNRGYRFDTQDSRQ